MLHLDIESKNMVISIIKEMFITKGRGHLYEKI